MNLQLDNNSLRPLTSVLPSEETLMLLSPLEAWELVLRASEDELMPALSRAFPAAKVRLYLDGCRVVRNLNALLPKETDKSFHEYARRLKTTTGRKYSLVVSELQSLSWILFDRVVPIMQNYFKQYGPRRADIGLYVGNDRFSAFGVHVDSGYHGFQQIVIEGDKQAFFWSDSDLSPQQVSSLENSSEFEGLRDLAIVLEAKEGQSFTWPATARHVMENLSEHSIAVSLAFRSTEAERISDTVTNAYRGLLERVLTNIHSHTGEVLDDARTIRSQLIETLLKPEEFEHSLLALVLREETSLGFVHTPRRKSAAFRPNSVFARKSSSVIRWSVKGSKVHFACCGHDFQISPAPVWVDTFLSHLDRTVPTTLAALCSISKVPRHEYILAEAIIGAIWSANGFYLYENTEAPKTESL